MYVNIYLCIYQSIFSSIYLSSGEYGRGGVQLCKYSIFPPSNQVDILSFYLFKSVRFPFILQNPYTFPLSYKICTLSLYPTKSVHFPFILQKLYTFLLSYKIFKIRA